jgi:hypothetical protein
MANEINEACKKRVTLRVAIEHEAALRCYADALNATKSANPGHIKAAAWVPSQTIDELSAYTSGTIYANPGPLIGMVPLYTIEAITALLAKGAK